MSPAPDTGAGPAVSTGGPVAELGDPERENGLLLAIIEAVSTGPGVEPLAAAVARLITAATATDVCFVHVLDDAGRSLALAGATPPFDAHVGEIVLGIGTGVTGWVASRGQPVVIAEHKEADPRYVPIPALRGREFTSMCSVPMTTEAAGLVGVLNVHTRWRRDFTERDVRLLTGIGRLVAGALHSARLHRRLAAREQAQERFTEHVIAAQETERRRVAGDIHDGISQRLVSLSYHLDAASRALAEDPAEVGSQLALARELNGLALDEARVAIGGLRPPVLDDLGLAGGLASLVRSAPGLAVTVDVAEARLPEHVEIALYRIAQESLQNVVKHAGASAVLLHYSVGAAGARLLVTDDGAGFDPVARRSADSYGLVSMRERAELVGGFLDIRSRFGAGTSIVVTVPDPGR